MIDYPALWQAILDLPSHRTAHSVHGPDHWKRVERNALILATDSGADVEIVRLFALFHDARRVNEWGDPEHGARGAALAASFRGELFELSDESFKILHYACTWHTGGRHHENPTIATCWDADRLDLDRCGITPDPDYMSTTLAKKIAEHGTIDPWLHLTKNTKDSSVTRIVKAKSF